jgi:diaminopimelate decarboxylase
LGKGVLTGPFPRIGGILHCGDAPLGDLAERFGTPLYVYDIRRIETLEDLIRGEEFPEEGAGAP